MRWLTVSLALWTGAAAQAQEIVMPSGLTVAFLDRFIEAQSGGERWLTLRYVTTRIGAGEGKLGYDDVVDDIDALCDGEGLAAASEVGDVDQVVITLMDRAVERGVHDPDATMFIGAYRPTEDGCVWE
ncbi:DUF6497 family protein [Tropicimonas sp. IMCC6043]|uniref:DUF6497 family protein n=1 Tax=Tropicimonas sp. IMCC6043 TaxID=2510645 RepID=UPI00101CDAC9|nr:DUF6497 family protein [Tropicimonas sp. IMCC6043]RYH10673.1 hypothetical protein EU800_08015 [Tropicimonas sp. IMCC6043]